MAKIDVKFGLGDEVFVFEKAENGDTVINKGKIEQICIDKEGTSYFIDDFYDEYYEDDIISVNADPADVSKKLYEVTENGRETTQGN